MRTVPSEGSAPCDLMVIGDRPGFEESREGRPFVGPAGRELWGRFAKFGLPPRDDWFQAYLVSTFSKEPATPAEIEAHRDTLQRILYEVKPELIVTLGSQALRWFYPNADLDKLQGLIFPSPQNPQAYLIPLYSPQQAVKQPELYQNDFHRGVQMIQTMLQGEWTEHTTKRIDVASYDCRNMSIETEGRLQQVCIDTVMGLDLEGTIEEPECLTLADRYAAWLVGADQTALVEQTFENVKRVVMHYAVRDMRACWNLGLELPAFEDLMLAAYLLDEPQALKTLAFRECGLEMDSYGDLISPIDEQRVRTTLLAARRVRGSSQTDQEERFTAWLHAARRTKNKTKIYLAKRKIRREKKAGASDKRCLTSLTKLLDTPAADSLRTRWGNSVFADRVPLPPEPTWKDIPPEIGVPYANGDAFAHLSTWRKLRPRLKAEGLLDCYRMDRAVLPMLARMEHVGMQVDGKGLEKLSRDLHLEYVKVCSQIEALLGYPLNPKAAADVSDTLFDDLDVTPTKLTKGGAHYTTGDKYLEARKNEHAVIPLIIQGRELWKLKSSYTEKLPKMLIDGRYHPEFGYTRTASGRLAETIILLIPKHSSFGKKIRNAFTSGDGRSLVSCDLAQIELRVLAYASQDREMLNVFRKGLDPHAITGHRLLGAPKDKRDQDESKHRLPSKKINFGMFMGLSELGLTEQIRAGGNRDWAKGCPHCDFTGSDIRDRPDHDAHCDSRVAMREYFKLYKGVRAYIDDRHAEARRRGYVRDMWGRKIYVAGIYSASRGVVGRFERMAQATPIQAGADGISKRWNAAIWDWLQDASAISRYYREPWTRTHDDTVLEVDTRIAQRTRTTMLKLVPQDLGDIPVLADGKIGTQWGDLKG